MFFSLIHFLNIYLYLPTSHFLIIFLTNKTATLFAQANAIRGASLKKIERIFEISPATIFAKCGHGFALVS